MPMKSFNMSKIAKNRTQDKLATTLAEYPQLLAFIQEGQQLHQLEDIASRIDRVRVIPKDAVRALTQIVKLGSTREITRLDLYAAYIMGRENGRRAGIDYGISRFEYVLGKVRELQQVRS